MATMEEEILQEMIRDRETQIKLVHTKLDLTATKVDRLRETLQVVRNDYSKQRVEHTLNLERLILAHSRAKEDLKQSLETLDMRKQQSPAQLHLYNEIMKAVTTPVDGDSSYVLRMQAQLCKAMHSMGMLEVQLVMIQNGSVERQKHLKEVITKTMDEKSQVELKIMNGLILGGDALREVEEKHREMVADFSKQKDALLEKIEKQKEKDEDDDTDGAEEEDDEEEKEELKEILSQGKEEIERMEAENKAELKILLALKAKVAAIRGEPFVEELMASIAEEYKQEDEEEEE